MLSFLFSLCKKTICRDRGQQTVAVSTLVALALLVSSLLVTAATAQDLYVSAAGANSVLRFDGQTGTLVGNFVTPGSGGLGDPQGIAFGPDGNLYVSSNGSNNVLRYDGQTGAFIDVFASVAGMSWPAEITFRDNFLFVSDFSSGTSGRVSRFDANTGSFVDHFITGASFADGQEFDANGDIYVSEFGANSVRKYSGVDGSLIGNFVAPFSGGLSGPLDNLFLDNGEFLVSSFNSSSIKRYAADGTYIDDPITGLNGGPQGLLIGPDGNLYAGDFGNGVINRYSLVDFSFIDTFASTAGASTTNNFVFGPSTVPEPSSFLLIGMIGTVWFTRRKNRSH